MNANLDTMPPRLREGALTDDDRMLYLMDEISRGARRAYDARIAKSGLNQTQWRIIGQLLREPSLTQAGITKPLEIGRASFRERVCQYVYITVVVVLFKKKRTNNQKNTL